MEDACSPCAAFTTTLCQAIVKNGTSIVISMWIVAVEHTRGHGISSIWTPGREYLFLSPMTQLPLQTHLIRHLDVDRGRGARARAWDLQRVDARLAVCVREADHRLVARVHGVQPHTLGRRPPSPRSALQISGQISKSADEASARNHGLQPHALLRRSVLANQQIRNRVQTRGANMFP